MSLAGKTIFISGASRGIGLAIALRAARDGLNIALAAKTAELHANLEGRVYAAAEQIGLAGRPRATSGARHQGRVAVAEAVRETAEKIGAAEVAMVAAPSALAVAKGGKGQVVLLSGEPAIGITDSLAKR
jgi:citronellol/citronellal dehydrogenase